MDSTTRTEFLRLAKRLWGAFGRASKQRTFEATPDALWTLSVALAGWWLKDRVADDLSGYRALPMLYGLFEGVQSLYSLVAGANGDAPDSDIDQRVQAVVKEVGKDKLTKALSNPLFARLQEQLIAEFPLPKAPVPMVKEQVASVEAPAARSAEGSPVKSAPGVSVPREGPKSGSSGTQRAPVSDETLAFLRKRYSEERVARILKG
jgi:hypothetical protein